MTPFFLFGNEVRPKINAQYPDKKITEVMKIIGRQYKMLPEAEKDLYKAMAMDLKVKYNQEMGQLKSTREGQELIEQGKMEIKKKRLARARRNLAKLFEGK